MENPWKTLSEETKYESPWIRVEEHRVINPAGNPSLYSKVHFKNFAIGIIVLDNDHNTWIVGQHRYPLNKYSWEIPEGGGDLNVPKLDSAKRELMEECGIIAQKWTLIYEFNTSNSSTDEESFIYLAQDLSFTEAQPEETEILEVKKIPFSELYKMVVDNKITDSLTVVAVFKLHQLISEKLI